MNCQEEFAGIEKRALKSELNNYNLDELSLSNVVSIKITYIIHNNKQSLFS